MTRISFILITARDNYPYAQSSSVISQQIHPSGQKKFTALAPAGKFASRKDLHVFDPTLATLKQQTMMDFELIIIDALYNERKDYFKNMDLPFPVKHVPAEPNLWHEVGLPGVCTQYNKGIIYADGELLFFTGDSYMFIPNFMKLLWAYFLEGYFPSAWYMRDYGTVDSSDPTLQTHLDSVRKAPTPYDMLGFTGDVVSIEHRYYHAFERDMHLGRADEKFAMPYEWWFANSTASLEAMLKINGMDQKFDGDRMLSDCDVGSRLELAGYGKCLRMFRNLFAVRVPSDVNVYAHIRKGAVSIKCNYGLIGFNRVHKQFKANVYKLIDKNIEWIKNVWCSQRCPLTESCKNDHPWQFPFEHKDVPSHPPGGISSKKWFNFWKGHQGLINLTEERDLRLDGHEKYQKGTFIN